jgi:hypothetical protein
MSNIAFVKPLIFSFLLLSNISAWSQTQKSLIGFQDMPWGTSLKQVKSKFKNAKPIDQCDASEDLTNLAKKEGWNCKILSSNYVIDGVSFDQIFHFDASDNLIRVELKHYVSNLKDANYTDAICDQLFKRIEHLLDSRYGSSLGVSNPEPRFFWGNSAYLIWLPLPTEILLSKSFENKSPFYKKYPDHKSCEVLIHYVPRVSAEAKKL